MTGFDWILVVVTVVSVVDILVRIVKKVSSSAPGYVEPPLPRPQAGPRLTPTKQQRLMGMTQREIEENNYIRRSNNPYKRIFTANEDVVCGVCGSADIVVSVGGKFMKCLNCFHIDEAESRRYTTTDNFTTGGNFKVEKVSKYTPSGVIFHVKELKE